MVKTWESHPIIAPRLHIIRAALKSHCDENYTSSVPTLMPQVEGILSEYVLVNNLSAKFGKINEVYNAVIGDLDNYPLSNWAIANTLLHQLQTNTYVYTDFGAELMRSAQNRRTSRHTVLHGKQQTTTDQFIP